jgi:hypothetical protein
LQIGQDAQTAARRGRIGHALDPELAT